jgi:hypothetical protein
MAVQRQRRLAARIGLLDSRVSPEAGSGKANVAAESIAAISVEITAARLRVFAASSFPRRGRQTPSQTVGEDRDYRSTVGS